MLNLHEIIELENKWKIYSNKKKKKKNMLIYIALGILLLLIIIFSIYFAYSKGASELKTNIDKSNQVLKEKISKVKAEKEKILENKKPTQQTNQVKEIKIPTPEVSTSANDEDLPILNILDIDVKNSSFKRQENSPKQKQIIKNIPKTINTSNTIVITDLNSNDKPVIKEELGDLEYLKLKFAETNSIYFALDIADTYYKQSDFKSAREWALKANKIDTNNDKTWIIFAKSSYKLGLKEQAINSLTTYLKTNNSIKAKQVLEQIKGDKI